jgi:hypothetical protein
MLASQATLRLVSIPGMRESILEGMATASPALKQKAENLPKLLSVDPFQQPPPYAVLIRLGPCGAQL